MNISTALETMRHNSNGYCLWVGAGVSLHLAGLDKIPLWPELIKSLQSETSITQLNGEYPDQLLELLNAVGRTRFQRYLRINILEKISKSIIDRVKIHTKSETCLPTPVRQIAHLGMLANPIVNFNIETFTSTLLAGPGGPYEVKYFTPKLPESVEGFSKNNSKSRGGMFRRHILHPHGAIDHSGICVMTSEEYKSMHGTLALQLAVHAAFSSNLVIIGMSLEDNYLREQISIFREQVREVLWFVGSKQINGEILQWTIDNKISIVEVGNWFDFWGGIESTLPKPDEIELLQTWSSMITSALYEFSNSDVTRMLNNLPADTPEYIRKQYIQHRNNLGENPVLSDYTIVDSKAAQELLSPIYQAIKIIRDASS